MKRQNIMQIATELLQKVPLDTLRGVLPDFKGMLEEREYRLMEKLGQKHKIPIPGMFLRRQIFAPDGEELKNEYGRSHTVNRNYYNLMFCQGAGKNPSDLTPNFGTGYLSITDTGGTVLGDVDDMVGCIATSNYDVRYDGTIGLLANAGFTGNGIVAGTSNAAEDFEGYELTALIPNGSGAGQMDYSQSELHAITNSILTLKDTLIRDINNNSGGPITAEEVGIYTGLFVGTSIYQVMITRDLTGGDVIADAAQYRVIYEITLVYPS